MALVQSNTNRRNNRNGVVNYLLPALAGLTSRAVDSAVRQAVNNLSNSSGQGGGSSRGKNGGGLRARRQRNASNNRLQSASSPSRLPTASSQIGSVARSQRTLRVRVRGSVTLNNSGVGSSAAMYYLAFDTGNSPVNMLSWITASDVKLLQAFTYFKVNSARVVVSSSLGTTAAGLSGVGFTDNAVGTPATIDSLVASTKVAHVGPSASTLAINIPGNNGIYYLNDTTQDTNHRRAGSFLWCSTNSSAAGAAVGMAQAEFDLTLWS